MPARNERCSRQAALIRQDLIGRRTIVHNDRDVDRYERIVGATSSAPQPGDEAGGGKAVRSATAVAPEPALSQPPDFDWFRLRDGP